MTYIQIYQWFTRFGMILATKKNIDHTSSKIYNPCHIKIYIKYNTFAFYTDCNVFTHTGACFQFNVKPFITIVIFINPYRFFNCWGLPNFGSCWRDEAWYQFIDRTEKGEAVETSPDSPQSGNTLSRSCLNNSPFQKLGFPQLSKYGYGALEYDFS